YALDKLRLGRRPLRHGQRHPAWIDRDGKNIDALVGIGRNIDASRIDRKRPDPTVDTNGATGHTLFYARWRHLEEAEADAVAACRRHHMHAAVEADAEDGNAALARRTADRQDGRRVTILLRHVKGTDLHHDISSRKALLQGRARHPRFGAADGCPNPLRAL